MKVRIKFTKEAPARYIGHLDILRTFQRCFNRAGIQMEYSEGFNPHQKMSFALPLGVGITSTAEYVDADIAAGQDLNDAVRRLNAVTYPAFTVLGIRELIQGADSAMAAVRYASYDVVLPESDKYDAAAYMAQPEIPYEKQTKSGTKAVDLKTMILDFFLEGRTLHLFLQAGTENNIKAEVIAGNFMEFSGIPYSRDLIEITRTGLYADNKADLFDYQTLLQ